MAGTARGDLFVDWFVNRRKEGAEFLVWESLSPANDQDGKTQYHMATLTDLNEREQILETFRHAEQVKLIGPLPSGILHEIRNPLIGLGGLATHLADQEELPQTARARCWLITCEATRIYELLESHLGLPQPRPFERGPCNLAHRRHVDVNQAELGQAYSPREGRSGVAQRLNVRSGLSSVQTGDGLAGARRVTLRLKDTASSPSRWKAF